MQTFWNSMFTGHADVGTAAAAAANETAAATDADELPQSKRARTTTTPSLPAPHDLQYIQNLYHWSAAPTNNNINNNAAAGAAAVPSPAALAEASAVLAPTVAAGVVTPAAAITAMLMAAAANSSNVVSTTTTTTTTNIVPSSASSSRMFLQTTPDSIPDCTTTISSSRIINDSNNNDSSSNNNNILSSNKRARLGGQPPQQQPAENISSITAQAAAMNNNNNNNNNMQEQRKRRNAINARLMRMRKKHAESMVDIELKALQRENEWLKNIVKREIGVVCGPERAQQIINDCCYSSSKTQLRDGAATAMAVISSIMSSGTARAGEPPPQEQQQSLLGHSDFELLESLAKSKQSFVLSDPRQVDNPIVYASCSFLRLTGYTREQVIGRNCRFLQGIRSDADQVAAIRKAVESGNDGAACLVNYKADGTPFWNHFFITALRDKKNRIVNFVGVQTEVDKPLDGIEPMMPAAVAAAPTSTGNIGSSSNPQDSFLGPAVTAAAAGSLTAKLVGFEQEKMQRLRDKNCANTIDMSKLQELEDEEENKKMPASVVPTPGVQVPIDNLFDDSTDVNMIDWSQLAEVLEADFDDSDGDPLADLDSVDEEDTTDSYNAKCTNKAEDIETNILFEKSFFSFFTKAPRALVILTIRSEIVDCMTRNDGDVSDPGFMSALELLSKLYREQRSLSNQNDDDDVIHGHWREISRPTYQHGGIIGTNSRGDKVYALGKMSFNLFKPGNLRVTVQSTINCIEPKADGKALPAAVPWSLRRELAQQGEQPSSSKLKSYDVVLAVTIEPGQFKASPGETIPSPSQRLRATYMVNGWFLPDPTTPSRLSVWFTGGQLSPVPTQQPPSFSPNESFSEETSQQNSSLDEWIGIFGAEHKRTWGEALSVMGAQLFLGAELPDEMQPDGTMSYTLHRPYGGHGRGYVDIMYADSEMLITKGNSGTVHVMVREDGNNNNTNT